MKVSLESLYQIADTNRINVYHFPMKEVVSMALPDNIAIDVDKIENNTEEKEHLAHELGHCMLHAFYNLKTIETRSRMETRADRWAIKKLLPFSLLKEAVTNGLQEPYELAEYFDLSEQFVIKAVNYYTQQLGLTFDN